MTVITSGIILLISTCLVVLFGVSKLIYISHKKHLFDEPGEDRKIHVKKVPTLGGLAIVAGILFCGAIFLPANEIQHINYLLAATLALFAVGVTDDLVGIDPIKKMAAQICVAGMAAILADIRMESLYGFLGFTSLPYWVSIGFSVFFMLFFINAINLIDGIDGLAGSIGLLSCAAFAFLFWKLQHIGFFYLSLGMCGALAGFLFFNLTPARIFMGDTGSLFLGFVISVLSIKYLELSNINSMDQSPILTFNPTTLVFAILVVPIYDTVRIFIVRLMQRQSPFIADRKHIHHELLNLGLSHLQTTGILLLVNISCIAITLLLKNTPSALGIFLITCYALTLNVIFYYRKKEIGLRKFRLQDEQPELIAAKINVNYVLKSKNGDSKKRKVSFAKEGANN